MADLIHAAHESPAYAERVIERGPLAGKIMRSSPVGEYHAVYTMTTCGDCGDVTRTEWVGRWSLGYEQIKQGHDWIDVKGRQKTVICRSCNAQCSRQIRRVAVKHSDAMVCNDKCMGATGPACECSCDGRNHGGSFAA